jgi:hypothetical protein
MVSNALWLRCSGIVFNMSICYYEQSHSFDIAMLMLIRLRVHLQWQCTVSMHVPYSSSTYCNMLCRRKDVLLFAFSVRTTQYKYTVF